MLKKWIQIGLLLTGLGCFLSLYSVETPLKKVGPQENDYTFSGDFTKVKASGAFDIHLIPSNTTKVSLDCPSGVRDQVNVEITNGILHLRYKDATLFSSGNQFVCASIYFEELTDIEHKGPGRLTAEESLKLGHLYLNKLGAGSILLNVDINDLDLVCRGDCQITLKGETDELLLTAFGSTIFDGSGFTTQKARVLAGGSSKILIHAKESLKVHLSGSAHLKYYGQPHLSLNKVAGQSRVEQAN